MKIRFAVLASLSIALLSACAEMPTGMTSGLTSGTTSVQPSPAQPLLAPPSYAATECGNNFSSSGDPRNGATFTSSVKLANLDTRSAIGQIEKMASDQGIEVGSDQVDNALGKVTMIVKDPGGGHDFPMLAAAQKATGRITLVAQLTRGETIGNDAMRDRMCDILAHVRMDAAGASTAAAMQQKLGSGKITDIKAVDLAQEIAGALRAKQDATEVTLHYSGRVYRLDGQVSRPNTGMQMYSEMQVARSTHSFNMPYITEVHAGVLGIGPMTQTAVMIMCRTAPDQFARFASLHDKDYATLIGTVVGFNGKGRAKSFFVENPLTTGGSILADQGYGGILNMDCRFEK